MGDYSFKELADMHYCYGFADGESQEAAQVYAEKFPNRRQPDHTVFEQIDAQLRKTGDLSQEDVNKCFTPTMADSEVKRKGRPKKRDADVVEVPTKKAVSNGDDSAPPVKRGRGRPPKGGSAVPKKTPVPGRGRGRPPKNSASKKKKKESEAEEEDDEDDEKKESSGDADSS